MSRKKSEFLGVAFEIFKAVADAVIARGGGDDDLRRIVSEEGLASKIAEMIMSRPTTDNISRLTTDNILEVNYDLAFDVMVAAGHYDYRNSEITAEHFPIKATGVERYEPVLVHLNRGASTEDALAEIRRLGLIPASAAELLAFGAKYPEEQGKYPVVALGQAWSGPHGFSYFPYLWFSGFLRGLYLGRGYDSWRDACRFLALRKVS